MQRTHNPPKVGSIPSASTYGTVVELVDTPDLKSVDYYNRAGSSPARPIPV